MQQPLPPNVLYLTLDGVSQLYYMLKQDEYMKLKSLASSNTAIPQPTYPVPPVQTNDEDEYIDREKVSRLLHVDKSTLWRWAKEGKLNFIKVGPRRVLYKTEDVKRLLNSNNVG